MDIKQNNSLPQLPPGLPVYSCALPSDVSHMCSRSATTFRYFPTKIFHTNGQLTDIEKNYSVETRKYETIFCSCIKKLFLKPYLVLKVTLDTLELVMSVDMSIEVDSCCCRVGAEMTLIHDPLLIRGQTELVLSIILVLHVAVDCVAVGDNAGGLGLGFSSVKNSVVQGLRIKQ